MTDLIAFVTAHSVELIALLALVVRIEMAVAKLTTSTTDDAIADKVATAVKLLGVDPTKPQ